MRIRLQADADLSHVIINGVLRREPIFDFRRAESVPLESLDDPTVLAICARDGRILVTHDKRTMPRHFRAFLIDGNTSPGVFLVPQDAHLVS